MTEESRQKLLDLLWSLDPDTVTVTPDKAHEFKWANGDIVTVKPISA